MPIYGTIRYGGLGTWYPGGGFPGGIAGGTDSLVPITDVQPWIPGAFEPSIDRPRKRRRRSTEVTTPAPRPRRTPKRPPARPRKAKVAPPPAPVEAAAPPLGRAAFAQALPLPPLRWHGAATPLKVYARARARLLALPPLRATPAAVTGHGAAQAKARLGTPRRGPTAQQIAMTALALSLARHG